MFDRLDDILIRYQQVMEELNDPDVVNDQPRFRKLMKEQNDLAPIVEKYTEYKQEKQNVEDSLELLEMESDEEMRELAKEEMAVNRRKQFRKFYQKMGSGRYIRSEIWLAWTGWSMEEDRNQLEEKLCLTD